MNWKKWPYWLKSGIIVVGFCVLLSVLLTIAFLPKTIYPAFIIPLIPVSYLAHALTGRWLFDTLPELIILIVLSIALLFLIGALIGVIVRNIKQSKP